MNKILKIVLQVTLVIVVVGLVFLLYSSIMEPIRFNKSYEKRRVIIKEKLVAIKDAQVAYRDTYNKYASSFDTLLTFIETDSLIFIKAEGEVPDSIYNDSKTRVEAETRAIELGLIKRDTIKISAKDSLFSDYNIDTLKYIPYTDLKKEFQLNATMKRTVSKATMPVFEVKVHNNSFTVGLDRQLVANKNDEARDNKKFPGLFIGSLDEVTTNGSWDD